MFNVYTTDTKLALYFSMANTRFEEKDRNPVDIRVTKCQSVIGSVRNLKRAAGGELRCRIDGDVTGCGDTCLSMSSTRLIPDSANCTVLGPVMLQIINSLFYDPVHTSDIPLCPQPPPPPLTLTLTPPQPCRTAYRCMYSSFKKYMYSPTSVVTRCENRRPSPPMPSSTNSRAS